VELEPIPTVDGEPSNPELEQTQEAHSEENQEVHPEEHQEIQPEGSQEAPLIEPKTRSW